MITLEKLLKELSPVSLNEIVAGTMPDRSNIGGSSPGQFGKVKKQSNKMGTNKIKSEKMKSQKSQKNKSGKG